MLGVLLALAIFVTFCDADCAYQPLEVTPGIEVKGCKDGNGALVNFGTTWNVNCIRCQCSKGFGLLCCSTIMRPVGYDKKKCKEIFNKLTCTKYAVLKTNPNIACESKEFIG